MMKVKCFLCGVFIASMIGSESLPIICHDCHHDPAPHTPEKNYAVEYNQISFGVASVVSGISDTTTVRSSQWPVINLN